MRVRATRVGGDVPADFDGEVRAVFRHAAVVALTPPDRDVRLVTLSAEAVPMTPLAVRVPADALAPLRAGDAVARAPGHLLAGEVRVALADAVPFAGALADAGPPPPEALAALQSRLALLARLRPQVSALAVAAREEVERRVTHLASVTAEGDLAAAARLARGLVGLGPGLTPSGDDALCGFLLGCELVREHGDAIKAVRDVAGKAWEHTTDEGAQYLALAARGRYGEALLDVAERLGAGDEAGAERLAARCASLGATSGADGLLGLAAALRCGVGDRAMAHV